MRAVKILALLDGGVMAKHLNLSIRPQPLKASFSSFVSEEGRHQMSAETVAAITEAFAKVKSGEIVPAANFNGLTSDAFTGL